MDQTWLEKVKIYAVQVVLKKMGPAAIASAISAFLAILAAHQGLLEYWGITFGNWPFQWPPGAEPSGQVILIELDTISKVSLTAVSSLIVALVAGASHHVAAAVKKAPQSGGQRATDKIPPDPPPNQSAPMP